MKVSQINILPAQPLHHTLSAAMNHVENSPAPVEVKLHTRVIVSNIQQNFNTIYSTGLYGVETEDVKSSIVQTLKGIKDEFHEKPWIAALKSLGAGLKLIGVGKAIIKGEFGTGDIKDISAMVGLSSVSNAIVSLPPTDILGIASLFIEKAVEAFENPNGI